MPLLLRSPPLLLASRVINQIVHFSLLEVHQSWSAQQFPPEFNDKHKTKDLNKIYHLFFAADTSMMKRNDSSSSFSTPPINMPFYYFCLSLSPLLQCFIGNTLHPLNWFLAHYYYFFSTWMFLSNPRW